MRRTAVSPAQRAEMRGVISGSDGLPESERTIRENSMPENRRPCPGVRGGAPGDPRDMAKVGLPETQPPEDASSHPPERHLKPAPVPAAGWSRTRGNPPGRRSDALSGHLRRRCEQERGRWVTVARGPRCCTSRWRKFWTSGAALRGGGLKPLTGALAEDRGVERSEKRRDLITSGVGREDERWAGNGPLPSEASK
jgi:hypothetical protein